MSDIKALADRFADTAIDDRGRKSWEFDDHGLEAFAAALAASPQVGEGRGWTARWHAEDDDSLILLTHPAIGSVGVWKEPREGRPMLEEMLYAFGKSLLAPPAAGRCRPAGVGRWGVGEAGTGHCE